MQLEYARYYLFRMYIDVEDIETTTFITNKGSYLYMVMAHG